MVLLLAASAAGAMISLAALGVQTGAFHGGSWCTAGSTFDCQAVLTHAYGRTVLPISAVAFGYFMVRLALAFLGCRRRRPPYGTGLPLSVAAVGIAASFLVVMIGVIGRWCWLCLLIDLCVMLLALADWRLMRIAGTREMRSWTIALIASAIAAVAILAMGSAATAAAVGMRAHRDRSSARSLLAGPREADAPAWRAGQAIQVVCFIDYRCASCLVSLAALREAEHSSPVPVAVEFVNFPLDPACNALVKEGGHPGSCRLAERVIAAQAAEDIRDIQQRIIAGMPFAAGDEDALALARLTLASDIKRAAAAHIAILPTYLMQGYRVEGAHSAEFFSALLHGIASAPGERAP